jgi:hypothetical protein
MSKDDGVDPFPATDATPIERREFEYPLRDHQPAAPVATVRLMLLVGCRPLWHGNHERMPPLG